MFSALGDMYDNTNPGSAPNLSDIEQLGGAGGFSSPRAYMIQADKMEPGLGATNASTMGYAGNMAGSAGNLGNVYNALGNTANQYQAYANGAAPSAAQLQMRQGNDQAQAAMGAQAASARGGFGLANANRNAMQTGAGMMQANNQNAGILRAQEQQAGLAGLSQTQQAQGQVLGAQGQLYGGAGNLSNASYNSQLALRAQQLQAAGMSMQQAIAQAQMEQQQNSLALQSQQFNSTQGGNALGGIVGSIGSVAGLAAL